MLLSVHEICAPDLSPCRDMYSNNDSVLGSDDVLDSLQGMNLSLETELEHGKSGRRKKTEKKSLKEIFTRSQSTKETKNEISQIQQLHARYHTIRKQIHIVNNENTELRQQIRDVSDENKQLENEVQQLRQHAQNSNLGNEITECGSLTVSNEVLARSAYATVYAGEFYGTEVAVKEFHEIILSPHNIDILRREINIVSQCRHPNILQFFCATQNHRGHLLIVTEQMSMTLRKLIEQGPQDQSQLDYEEVWSISMDVARGLDYLHSKKPNPIIHRNVSSVNVLLWIGNGGVGRAKLSVYDGSGDVMQVTPEAVIYAAPEANLAQPDPKIDVFSYGLLVCETCICKRPDPLNRKKQTKEISKVAIRKLVKGCTQKDPRKRPTMQHVIGLWQKMNK